MDDLILRRILSKTTTIDNFNFDNMVAPPLLSFLTVQDIEYFRYLATSIKYSAKIEYKYKEIDRVMRMRGFVKLSAGTNRVVYRYLENQSIVIKIAIDDVGMKDNPREFVNQQIFKPYVTKIFEVSPCGTVALVERVQNIKSREEFASIAGDVFDIISKWFVGEYVLEDIGTNFFMNWGIRPGFGCVLIDFPYVYKLDGNKLYCQAILNTGEICNGEIDYDDGFNHLYCTKCGLEYKAVDLKKLEDENKIVKKGSNYMMDETTVVARKGNKIIKSTEDLGKKKITRRERTYMSLPKITDGMIVTRHGGSLADKTMEKAIDKVRDEIESPVKETNDQVVSSAKDEEFDTHSTFIPEEKESSQEEEREYKEESIAIDPEEECDDEESTYREEEHLNLDPSDEENIPEDNEEEPDYSKIPVGAMPPKNIKNNKNQNKNRSKRFDPNFYKNV